MRLVTDPDDLESAFQTASSEARRFADGSLYVERALVGRHVEIQVLGDGEGGALTLGERDCSIQRRHQKLVEEGPSPAVSPDSGPRWRTPRAGRPSAPLSRRRHADFLLDEEGALLLHRDEHPAQVEHPVTELITASTSHRPSSGSPPARSFRTARAELRIT